MSQRLLKRILATPINLSKTQRGLCLHAIVLVRNGEFLSALSATCGQYSATIGGSHSLTETVLVFSLSVRGLKCSFHLRIYVLCYYSHEFGLQK